MHGSILLSHLRERVVTELFDVSVAEAVAAAAIDGKRRGKADGVAGRPFLLEGERDWLLGRLGEKPDLTLPARASGRAF